MKRILAFHCHPDDVEMHMAGTLALMVEQGWEAHIATMAGGEVGSASLAPQRIRQVRMKESVCSAKIIEAEYHYAGGHDLKIVYDNHHLRLAVKVIRDVKPDIVLAPPPTDYLADHEETSRLVRTAAFIASVPNFDCGISADPTKGIPHLYYSNAMGLCDCFGQPLPLHFVVNISSVFDTKRAMLDCHQSQKEWLKHVTGIDNLEEEMKLQSASQGKKVGVSYGEGFVQHLGSGHPQDNILKSILGDLCMECI